MIRLRKITRSQLRTCDGCGRRPFKQLVLTLNSDTPQLLVVDLCATCLGRLTGLLNGRRVRPK